MAVLGSVLDVLVQFAHDEGDPADSDEHLTYARVRLALIRLWPESWL